MRRNVELGQHSYQPANYLSVDSSFNNVWWWPWEWKIVVPTDSVCFSIDSSNESAFSQLFAVTVSRLTKRRVMSCLQNMYTFSLSRSILTFQKIAHQNFTFKSQKVKISSAARDVGPIAFSRSLSITSAGNRVHCRPIFKDLRNLHPVCL